jgi:pyrroloquinoline-quinone synthase
VRENTSPQAIASSLTKLFAPQLDEERIARMLKYYCFVRPEITTYFQRRPDQVPCDATYALAYVHGDAGAPDERARVCDPLTFKTNCLWAQLHALYDVTSVAPPGAFRSEGF